MVAVEARAALVAPAVPVVLVVRVVRVAPVARAQILHSVAVPVVPAETAQLVATAERVVMVASRGRAGSAALLHYQRKAEW